MKHKPKKLDKRYNGSDSFKYLIDVKKAIPAQTVPPSYYSLASMSEKRIEFVKMRQWAWETWGPSCEIAFYDQLEKDYVWSRDQENDHLRIYLKTEKELSWFLLKWAE